MQATKYKIDDIVQGLFDGPHATPKPSNKGAIFLGINNITPDGKLDLTDIRHISEDDLPKWTKRVTPLPGDIVFTYEATLNRYAIIPKGFRGCLGRRLALIRVNSTKANNRFLYYYFFTNDWRSEVDKHLLSGSTVDRIPLSEFPNFFIKLPDKQTQDKIANVVCNYDSLIENNEKRIKILEEMAQGLYTEWFVKLKFPGSEKVKMVDSGTEFGLIPDGWKIDRLNHIADIVMGQSPESKYYNSEKNGLPFHQGVADFGDKYPINRIYSTKGNRYARNGDLLFSVRAPVGKLNISTENIIIGRGLCAIRSIKALQSFLIASFYNRFKEKDTIGNGAVYKSVNKTEIESLKFIIPTDEFAHRYEEIAFSYFQEMEKLTEMNSSLSKIRDLLIPQLVTGKRELKNA